MEHIAAVDIGIHSLKMIHGWKKRDLMVVENGVVHPYSNELLQTNKVSSETLKEVYKRNFIIICKDLEELAFRLPKKTTFMFTFNSLFSHIFVNRIKAPSMKRVRIQSQIYLEKLAKEGFETNYEIVNYDHGTGEAEVILYSYLNEPFDFLLELLRSTGLNAKVVDFDALCIANALERRSAPEECNVLIDFGCSKTSLIFIKNMQLHTIHVIPYGMMHVAEQITSNTRLSLIEAQTLIMLTNDYYRKIAQFTPMNLYHELMAKVKTNIDQIRNEHPKLKVYISGGIVRNRAFQLCLEKVLGDAPELFDPFPEDINIGTDEKNVFAAAYGLFTR